VAADALGAQSLLDHHWKERARFHCRVVGDNHELVAGSEQYAWYRMVVSYWEMAASFLVQGIVHEELFFLSNGELVAVWDKIRRLTGDFRVMTKNPLISRNLEKAAAKHIAWLNQHAPGACEAMQEWMSELPPKG
jgi:hypothetical protein